MEALIVALLQVAAPIYLDIIARHQAANNGALPTVDQMTATLAANADRYLGEGSAWRAAHPR